MFPLPVANGKNRPTTLASTQFGGSGTVILFFPLYHNVSCNKFLFGSRDAVGEGVLYFGDGFFGWCSGWFPCCSMYLWVGKAALAELSPIKMLLPELEVVVPLLQEPGSRQGCSLSCLDVSALPWKTFAVPF